MSSVNNHVWPIPPEAGLVPGYVLREVPDHVATPGTVRDWVIVSPKGRPIRVSKTGSVYVHLASGTWSFRASRKLAALALPAISGPEVLRNIDEAEVTMKNGMLDDETMGNLNWNFGGAPMRKLPQRKVKDSFSLPKKKQRAGEIGLTPAWILQEFPDPFGVVVRKPGTVKPGTPGYFQVTAPQTAPNAAPQTAPETAPEAAPETAPPAAPDMVPCPCCGTLVSSASIAQPSPPPEPPLPAAPAAAPSRGGRPRTRPFGPRRAPGRPRTRPPHVPLPPVVSPEKPTEEPYWLPG